jgi:putative DNA primase/helicase
MPHFFDNVPPFLKRRPNWVAWGVGSAPLKEPFNPASLLAGRPLPAKSGAKETWTDYKDAVECVRRGLARGIGYEFDGGGLYGVDLDHVIDEAGTFAPQALKIVGLLNSYTEVSPSGKGLHVFVFAPGANIARHRKKDGFVEIYGESRYFTVTGDTYGDPKPIARRTAELQTIHDEFLPEGKGRESRTPPPATAPCAERDEFLRIGLCRDGVFAALWEGARRHGNESADDQALMNKLAYWMSADENAMVRTFLQSPHYAKKDEAHKKKCERADYLPNTARKAADTVYSTARTDCERRQRNRGRERRPRTVAR